MDPLAPKTRGDQRSKQNKYKPRQYQRGRGGSKARRPHLQSNAYRFENSDEENEQQPQHEGGAVQSNAELAPARAPAAREPKPKAPEPVDDLESILSSNVDFVPSDLVDHSDSEAEDEEDYEDEEDGETSDSDTEILQPSENAGSNSTRSRLAKDVDEFVPDEVDELDSFLAETSISAESAKFYSGNKAQKPATPSKGNDPKQVKQWLDSVMI